MREEQAQMTFAMCIEECRNYTWQGKLTAEEKVLEFKSETELLLAMDTLIYGEGEVPS